MILADNNYMDQCDKCWREHLETIHCIYGVFRYCGLHAKELKIKLYEEKELWY